MKNTSAILLTFATLCLTACDTIITEKCTITPVGAQGISEDMDLDGVPDHGPFMVAKLTDGCTEKMVGVIPVALYEQGPDVISHGFGTMSLLNDACAMWTWSTDAVVGDWGVAITPANSPATGVFSPSVVGLTTGARLPAWWDGAAWTARLPAGIPAGCEY
jgi:hypothetical protein